MKNKLKIVLSIFFLIVSCTGIITSSYFISKYGTINDVIKTSSAWELYGFIIFLIISVSIFIICTILILDFFYLMLLEKKISKGEKNG